MGARVFLLLLNFAAKLSNPSHCAVRAGGVISKFGGQFVHAEAGVALGSATSFAIGAVTGPDGATPPRARSWRALMFDLDDVAELREAARHMRGEAEPSDLYKVFEIIRSERGSDPATLGWATKAEQGRFTRSVNDPKALGDRARHARLPGEPQAGLVCGRRGCCS